MSRKLIISIFLISILITFIVVFVYFFQSQNSSYEELCFIQKQEVPRYFNFSNNISNYSILKEKAEILEYLTNISKSDKVILAQQLGEFGWDEKNVKTNYYAMEQYLGKTTKMIGLGLGWDEVVYPSQELLDSVVNYTRNGGILTFIMDPKNPITLGSVRDTSQGPTTLSKVLNTNSSANLRWKNDLKIVGDVFEYLQKEGVVVLFRSYHEMNGDWFWWGHQNQSDYILLWKQTYDYLTIERNLSNILWVYSPNVEIWPEQFSTDLYYPGNEYVDIISLDYYYDDISRLNQNGSFTKLLKYGKPFAMETGPSKKRDGSFDARIYLEYKKQVPQIAYVLVWNSWSGAKMSLVDTWNGREVIEDSKVIVLD